MKILSVSLHNIASIEGPFTLNLEAEPLQSAGLFAITGATGAGKSTILDAICLALYNDTPRLAATKSTLTIADGTGEVQVNNVKNLLRKGAASGYAKVQFQAIDGKHYEAEWQLRRARGKHNGSLQDEKLLLTCLTDNEPYPESRKTLVLERIKTLVGLSFSEFTKSVILAQGDFTSFLKANDDKRSDILEKLTGTEIYTQLSKQIYEINKQKQQELAFIQAQLSNTQLLTETELSALREALTADEQALQQQRSQLATLKAQQQWFAEVQHLRQLLQEARAQKEKAINEKEAQTERFSLLAKVEQFQAIKADFTEKERETKQLFATEQQLKAAFAEKERLDNEKKTLLEQKTTAETHLATTQQAYNKAKPAIEQAKTLDVQLQEAQRNLQTKKKDFEAKSETLTKKKTALTTAAERLKTGNDYVQKEALWCETHPDAEKLHNNKAWVTQVAAHQQELLSLLHTNETDRQQTAALLKTLALQTPEVESKNISTESLIETQKQQRSQLQQYQQDRAIAERYEAYELQKQKTETELSALHLKADELKNSLLSLAPEEQTAQTASDTAERIYQRTQLEHSNNVIVLRQQLTEGEPCPVCGAVHHPNAHKDFSPNIINTVKEAYLEAKQALEALKKEHITKETQLKETQQRISHLQQSLAAETLPPPPHKLTHIKAQIAAVQQQQQQTDFLLQEFNKYKALTDTLKTLADKTTSFQQQINKNNQQIASLQLSDTFSNLWHNHLPRFSETATQAATEWATHQTHLTKYQQALTDLAQQHSQLEGEILPLEEALTEQQTLLVKAQQELTALTAARQELLGGKPAAEVQNNFEQQISSQNLLLTQAQNDYHNTQLAITANQKTTEGLKIQREKAQKTINEASQRIDSWLNQHYAGQETTVIAQLPQWASYSLQWIETERNALQTLNEQITQSSTIVAEKETQLSNLQAKRPTNLSETETQNQYTAAVANEEQLHERVVSTKSKLLADDNEREKAAQLHHQREEKSLTAQRWQKLTDLIGSANGTAFRKYAQEYTLDVLLQYANAQMKYINKRYTLQRIPNSLSLQVVDNDMAAEVRSVYSLSGGESFLVSLALALALSSLSSTQMNIETMFIDEGFGSLDSNTLSIALDALESLQNQGKKIGVISHVHEMVERIAVKVIVQKEGNGKSKIIINN